jgi:hypothetical protein
VPAGNSTPHTEHVSDRLMDIRLLVMVSSASHTDSGVVHGLR